MAALGYRLAGALLACVLAAAPAWAQGGPEQLDQIEPEKGAWQFEYYGTFGGDGEQGFEALAGVSDWLALGGEAEFEGPRGGLTFDSAAVTALVRLADPEQRPIGLGVQFQASVNRSGDFGGFETRLIAETRSPQYWLQGAVILRHAREDGERGTGLAYAASVQHSVGKEMWLGVEASGQFARLSGDAELAPRGQHYAGPSLTIERPIGGDNDVELGLAWLQRLRGAGPGSGPRIFAQFTF